MQKRRTAKVAEVVMKEGGLAAPTRPPLAWQAPEFYAESAVLNELGRVYELCHGCRRCVSLCRAFPTLFDLIDESANMDLASVARADYWSVVDQCYLCDLCYQTKCPYIPPHEWNIDFPHLMLRAKATRFKQGKVTRREKILAATDAVGRLASMPVVVHAVNAANRNKPMRAILRQVLGVHRQAKVPKYHSYTLRQRLARPASSGPTPSPTPTASRQASPATTGQVALFATCYGNYNAPQLGEDLVAILRHNQIAVTIVDHEQCCGMPKFELGDLEAVARAKEVNIPVLAEQVARGWDLMAPVPSCVLMFRQELPLMFPHDEAVARVAQAMFDPFEYLWLRHKAGLLHTDFSQPLGKVAYHVACHQRVQKIGMKTRDCLQLVPGTEVVAIERCSGHNGTYGVKEKSYAKAGKIARPVTTKIRELQADYHTSDCPMAGGFLAHILADGRPSTSPATLLRRAYGI